MGKTGGDRGPHGGGFSFSMRTEKCEGMGKRRTSETERREAGKSNDGQRAEKGVGQERSLPFDSERKRMTTVHAGNRTCGSVSFTKGAPDVILERCAPPTEDETGSPSDDGAAETNIGT